MERRWTTCLCHFSRIVCNWDYCHYLAQTSSHVVACIMGKSNLKVCVVFPKAGGHYRVYLVIGVQMRY